MSQIKTPSPLSKDDWRALRSELLALRELQRREPEPCGVCQEPMIIRERALFTTSCGHTFHFACLKRLIVEFAGEPVASSCPLCRTDFAGQTPPRTPLSERTAGLPGFVTARALACSGAPASMGEAMAATALPLPSGTAGAEAPENASLPSISTASTQSYEEV